MESPIKFGTDGWRGIIAQDFTFDNVRACAQAVAGYLKEAQLSSKGLIVGYDTRFASEDFAVAVAEVVSGNGIKVLLCSRATPTPVISHAVLEKKVAGAVIITASHNSYRWNGFKYKPEYGGSASPDVIEEIEKRLPAALLPEAVKRIPIEVGLEQGLIEYLDPSPDYLHHIGRLVDLDGIRQAGLKIVADSMYGAGAGYFETLLKGGSTQLLEINGERNPLFSGIQPEPIAQNLTRLSALVKEGRASVGLATDGDGDRIGIVDEKGAFVNQLEVFSLLAIYLLEVRGERGAIVKSLTSSNMLYRLGELFGVQVYETPVGFKYIGPKMVEVDALIGGEESGGFAFRGHIPERDGILAGLYILDLMIKLGKSPSELVDYLFSKVGPHYYDRIDLQFPSQERQRIIDRLLKSGPDAIEGVKLAGVDTMDGFRFKLVDGTWLLVRFSGTEPVLRIYTETDSLARLERLLAAGRRLAGV